jgi:hypothetical protein
MIEGVSRSKVHVVHFADALKRACSEIFGIPLSDMETETGKQKLTDVKWPLDYCGWYEGMGGPHDYPIWVAYDDPLFSEGNAQRVNPVFMTVREVLQFVGTELFRTQMEPEVWVKSIFRRRYADDDVVVIADCRFPNEAEFARERGLLINVQRDTGIEHDGHASETALDGYMGYHEVVQNDGTFEDLRVQLEKILYTNHLLD